MSAPQPFVYARRVRFDEVDPAGIVFFARYLHLAHEAMEALFDGLAGGYSAFVRDRGLGVPAVLVTTEYFAPLRHGDDVLISVEATRVGTTSFTLRYRFSKAHEGAVVAEVHHTCVLCALATLAKQPITGDVRALLESIASPQAPAAAER